MTLLEFKDKLTTPLKATIDQHKSATLTQFASREDLNRHLDRSEGMVLALNHIEQVYAAHMANQTTEQPGVDIIPPQ